MLWAEIPKIILLNKDFGKQFKAGVYKVFEEKNDKLFRET
jgi:hypothetical protein